MPRNKFTPKPPVEKLPLAVRKDIHDKYEENKADFERQISELLGVAFTLDINANEVYAYVREDNPTPLGEIFASYINGFIDSLKSFLETYDEEGKKDFNAAVSEERLSLNVNELGDNALPLSADIKDGVYRILFAHPYLGYDAAAQYFLILPAIEEARIPGSGFALVAKASIANDYEDQIGPIQKEIAQLTGMEDVVLDPNFKDNYEALEAAMRNKGWLSNFGKVPRDYFEALKNQLEAQGFRKDDMLREGLQDKLTSKTFKVRIVKETKNNRANETVIEDGVVYLQTTANQWWYSVNGMGAGLIELL